MALFRRGVPRSGSASLRGELAVRSMDWRGRGLGVPCAERILACYGERTGLRLGAAPGARATVGVARCAALRGASRERRSRGGHQPSRGCAGHRVLPGLGGRISSRHPGWKPLAPGIRRDPSAARLGFEGVGSRRTRSPLPCAPAITWSPSAIASPPAALWRGCRARSPRWRGMGCHAGAARLSVVAARLRGIRLAAGIRRRARRRSVRTRPGRHCTRRHRDSHRRSLAASVLGPSLRLAAAAGGCRTCGRAGCKSAIRLAFRGASHTSQRRAAPIQRPAGGGVPRAAAVDRVAAVGAARPRQISGHPRRRRRRWGRGVALDRGPDPLAPGAHGQLRDRMVLRHHRSRCDPDDPARSGGRPLSLSSLCRRLPGRCVAGHPSR